MSDFLKFTSDTVLRRLFYIYSGLLFLPALYRIYFPTPLGDYAYYIIAFLGPAVVMILHLSLGKISTKKMLAMLAVLILIIESWLFSSGNNLSLVALFHGFKVYLLPILIFFVGYNISLSVNKTAFIKFILFILIAHLIFSLLYYHDVLVNPMYNEYSDRFSENWVVTVGEFKAFIGLTLSKFDLAYQVGFMLVGLILSRKYFKSNSRISFICIILGIILVIFTYNKTLMIVLVLTIGVWTYRIVRKRSRYIAYIWVFIISASTVITAVSFLTNVLNLTEIFKFLSPQTFWSRILRWQDYFHFDPSCIWRGYGGGYFDMNKITLDNQYLYTYLELGVIGAIIYFSLFAYIFYQYSPKNKMAKTYIAMLFLVFIGGDIIGALVVTYICGLFFGQLNQLNKAVSFSGEGHENRC